MKRWFCLAMSLLLFVTVLAACGKAESGAASSESDTASSAESRPESGPGDKPVERDTAALLTLRGKTLSGMTEETYADRFDEIRVQRPEETSGDDGAEEPGAEEEEQGESTALSFSFTRYGEEEFLAVTGSISLATDAYVLFDFYVDEEEEDPYAGADDTAAFLTKMAAAALSEEEGDVTLKKNTTNGLTWQYGFGEAKEDGGNSVLNFVAFCISGDLVVYVNMGASVTDSANAPAVLEKVRSEMTGYISHLQLR